MRNKKLQDISDIRDESSKGKIRIVLELRRDANPQFTINNLLKFTDFQTKFDGIMLALVNGQPKLLNLKEIIATYVRHRQDVVLKRTKYDLKVATDRQHITEGLLIALKDVDYLISLIKKSANTTIAFENLQDKLKLSKKQAEAILDMKLSKLTHLEMEKLKEENEKLKLLMKELQKIIDSSKEILEIIRKEVLELRRVYGDSRRTTIFERLKEITEKELVMKKDVILTITQKGYVKRMDIKTYKEQKRGGRGVVGADLATGDFVKQMITCSTHDTLLLFTSRGRLYWQKAYEIPEVARYGKGKPIINLLNIQDEITTVMPVKEFKGSLVMVTQKGIIKRVNMEMFSNPRKGGVNAINLNGDRLIDVELIDGTEELILATKEGNAIRFKANEVREMGRNAYGVTGIKLEKDDIVVGVAVLHPAKTKGETILTVTENGFGKRTSIDEYRLTGRACKGVININTSDRNGKVVGIEMVNDKDSVIVTTAKGIVIRVTMKDIREMGRNTQGVKIIKAAADNVTSVTKVQKTEEGDEVDE
jgi:DNA gyrase subunit A